MFIQHSLEDIIADIVMALANLKGAPNRLHIGKFGLQNIKQIGRIEMIGD